MKLQKVLLAGIIILIASALQAQSVTEKRIYRKSLPFSNGSRIEIKNKYGNVMITTWNKDSAYIRAELEAFAPDKSKIEKMLDGININITGTSSLVRAETEFNREITVLFESFKGLTKKIIDYDSRVCINYFVNLPANADVNIENQFGDISIENNSGILSVNLSNGDFKANSLNRIAELSMNFGEAEIGTVRSGKISTTFSEFVINNSEDLTINSTSARFELKKAGKLNVESHRDKFFIGTIDNLSGASYFTHFRIDRLTTATDITLKYGSLDAGGIDNSFERISLNSVYSDITLSFVPSASYEFEIRHTNAFVGVPDKNSRSKKEALNEDKKEYLTTGTTGTNPGSRKVRIDASRGNIFLK
ncbi:MAG: hypothetical protein Q8868_04120 [Bacteroidota bacterium]|nr:hypothetical protein [Bacteroidota bacterium]